MIEKRKKNFPLIATPSAVKRIAEIIKTAPENDILRISVEGGGCSGFSYKFQLVKDITSDDTLIEKDGARIVIDSFSLDCITGSVLDFVDDLMGMQFQIQNPNAVSSCGCGTSFSIEQK